MAILSKISTIVFVALILCLLGSEVMPTTPQSISDKERSDAPNTMVRKASKFFKTKLRKLNSKAREENKEYPVYSTSTDSNHGEQTSCMHINGPFVDETEEDRRKMRSERRQARFFEHFQIPSTVEMTGLVGNDDDSDYSGSSQSAWRKKVTSLRSLRISNVFTCISECTELESSSSNQDANISSNDEHEEPSDGTSTSDTSIFFSDDEGDDEFEDSENDIGIMPEQENFATRVRFNPIVRCRMVKNSEK